MCLGLFSIAEPQRSATQINAPYTKDSQRRTCSHCRRVAVLRLVDWGRSGEWPGRISPRGGGQPTTYNAARVRGMLTATWRSAAQFNVPEVDVPNTS